ncbi:MAG: excinuclease ABC subunit UvrC [Bacteroidaceae bacterium]|nr:excinuclease ABC subunit UvrC [Bacteroidaceae bacterium]
MTARNDKLMTIVAALPEKPGCYQYFDSEGTIIYVGKAKNLKRRVSSYFLKNVSSRKTRILVSKIRDIQYVVVPTEEDALLLENNLIKRYKPRYNILLKDDKTYPSVCVTHEYLPRIFKTRNTSFPNAEYYGPFSHAGILNNMLELIRRLYPLRSCRMPITEDGIRQGKYSTCLEYHIKNCQAPCIGRLSHEQYMNNVREVKEILKGNTRAICSKLLGQMNQLASELRFEEAETLKQKYLLAMDYCEKTEVIAHYSHDIDVFSIADDEKSAFINFLHVTHGCINQAFTFEYSKRMDETPEELLALGIVEMRERYDSHAKEIILPFEIETELTDVTITVPQRGEKHDLLGISLANVRQYKFDKARQAEKLNPEQRNTNLLKALKEHLHLDNLPYHIECFDNSNISGTDAVAGCVVFKGAKPSKDDYRKYNIRTVIGPDDYASMAEVVFRRYGRIKAEHTSELDKYLPDLIIADGGKGQMEVIRRVIEDELHLSIPIAGLAKDGRHRTSELLVFEKDGGISSVGIDVKTPLFQFLTRIQDEVHRFAITFHRDKRSHRQTKSQLDDIKGIGPQTKEILLRHFKSVKRIRNTSTEELAQIIGPAKAKLVTDFFS